MNLKSGLTDSAGKLARWRLRLFEFEFGLVHPTWINHQAADVLSQLITTWEDEMVINDDISVLCITFSSLQKKKRPGLRKCKEMTLKTTIKVSDKLKITR